MYRPIITTILLAAATLIWADTPELKFAFDIRAEISAPIEGEMTSQGKQITIPITGGDVTGRINGRIIPGGADRQIVDTDRKVTRLKAEYSMITDDSTLIKVTNEGINCFSEGGYYFMTSPRFDCDPTSSCGWLNDRIFICRPVEFGNGWITLRVWEAQ